VQWCCKMSQIGMSLSRVNVVELVNDMIKDTDFERKFIAYKTECKLDHKDGQHVVGISQYNKFMRHNKHTLKRGQCKPHNINWYSWCTIENFANMYDGVYNNMVNAGIAEKLDNEIMYDKFGE
jgi:hypothetical protein